LGAAIVPGKTPEAESTVTPGRGVNDILAVSRKSPSNSSPTLNVTPVISREAAISTSGFTPFKTTGTSSVTVSGTGEVEVIVGFTFVALAELLNNANSFPEF
jgi:hypothetical protein